MEDELDFVWDTLDEVNRSLDKGTPPSFRTETHRWWNEKIFRTVTAGKPGGPRVETVYRRLQKWLDKDLQARVVPKIAAAADSANAEETFTIVAKSFADFCALLRFTEIMLKYIDDMVRGKMGHGTIRDAFFSAFDKSVSAKVNCRGTQTACICCCNMVLMSETAKQLNMRTLSHGAVIRRPSLHCWTLGVAPTTLTTRG